MSSMVAGWIVSVTLFIVCGFIAVVLARVVYWLDRVSAMPDATEPSTSAEKGRHVLAARSGHRNPAERRSNVNTTAIRG